MGRKKKRDNTTLVVRLKCLTSRLSYINSDIMRVVDRVEAKDVKWWCLGKRGEKFDMKDVCFSLHSLVRSFVRSPFDCTGRRQDSQSLFNNFHCACVMGCCFLLCVCSHFFFLNVASLSS